MHLKASVVALAASILFAAAIEIDIAGLIHIGSQQLADNIIAPECDHCCPITIRTVKETYV